MWTMVYSMSCRDTTILHGMFTQSWKPRLLAGWLVRPRDRDGYAMGFAGEKQTCISVSMPRQVTSSGYDVYFY